jgi:hypothetical protein
VLGSSGRCLLPAIVQILEKKMLAHSSLQNSWPPRRSHTDRLWLVSRPEEAEFPPAAQTALELLDWILRGPRAVDCAPNVFGALRPHINWFRTEDYYEISISRERLAAATPRRIPKAVRWARRPRGIEGSRKKEPLAENHGPLRRRRQSRKVRRPGTERVGSVSQWRFGRPLDSRSA